MITLFSTIHISYWGLALGLAALLALGATAWWSGEPFQQTVRVWVSGTLGALLGGHAVWCLCSWNRLPDYAGGSSLLWKPWLGGYCMIGAVFGGLLFIKVCQLLFRCKRCSLTDLAVPGALLALCVARAAEYFTGQGLSSPIYDSDETVTNALMGFPFTIPVVDPEWEEYITWHIPVFFYEALTAFVLFVVSLFRRKHIQLPGQLTGEMLVLLSACQILLEQLRNDDCLRFGFVRVTQPAAMLAILAVLLVRLYGRFRAHALHTGHLLRLLTLFMCAVVIGLVEFAFEKPLMVPWLRVSMLVCACLGACCILDRLHHTQSRPWPWILSASLIVLLTVVAVCMLSVGDNPPLLLYTIMAASCAGAAATVLSTRPVKKPARKEPRYARRKPSAHGS